VLAEAMAAGALPLAAANAGYAGLLADGGTALLVPPGNAEALAARLIALSGAPAERARLADWARARARAFDIAAVGPAYLALYERVLRQAGRAV